MKIVQIAPEIGPGSGVAAVAYHLEGAWQRRGAQTFRFTMAEARGAWLPAGGPGLRGRLGHALRVVWFSTVGTHLARRYLRRHDDAVAVCHNDALAGHVYVNHGLLRVAMRARGHYRLRMIRNPLHVFTMLRDNRRYGPHSPHRLVVNLTAVDDRLLHELHPHLAARTVIIGNGIDLSSFAPPSDDERRSARSHLEFADHDMVVAFVGHEFGRKGLPVLLDSLALLPTRFKLLVVGGTPEMIEAAAGAAATRGLGARVRFAGRADDPRPFLHASDVLALPSAYEAYPLVVLEALACGVPVVATPTGSIPDLVRDGENGFVVPAEPAALSDALAAVAKRSRAELARAARCSVRDRSWDSVADQYIHALHGLGLGTSGGQAQA